MRETPCKLTKDQLLGLMHAEVTTFRLCGNPRDSWAYEKCMKMIRNVEEGRCSDDHGLRDDRMTHTWANHKTDYVRSWKQFAAWAQYMNKDIWDWK